MANPEEAIVVTSGDSDENPSVEDSTLESSEATNQSSTEPTSPGSAKGFASGEQSSEQAPDVPQLVEPRSVSSSM